VGRPENFSGGDIRREIGAQIADGNRRALMTKGKWYRWSVEVEVFRDDIH
jgi:hypothetical protein